MNYEVKNVKPVGAPATRDGVYGVPLAITSGVVGQTHPGFTNDDDGFCPILETDNSISANEKIAAYATAFVTDKYPNT